MAGGFLGDFIKGRLSGKLPVGLEQGVSLHRAIDAFTDQHAIVRQSQRRFDRKFRRYSAIICDIAFDHILASNWRQYTDIPLDLFCQEAYRTVIDAEEYLPVAALASIRRMQISGALESYGDEKFVDLALKSISKRLSRENPLAAGFDQFLKNKPGLQRDFEEFMPVLTKFVRVWINKERLSLDPSVCEPLSSGTVSPGTISSAPLSLDNEGAE